MSLTAALNLPTLFEIACNPMTRENKARSSLKEWYLQRFDANCLLVCFLGVFFFASDARIPVQKPVAARL